MRMALIAAAVLAASSAEAGAGSLDLQRDLQAWYRQALTAAESIWRTHPRDREVIAPPEDIDGKMALAPPAAGPRMPIIRPRSDR